MANEGAEGSNESTRRLGPRLAGIVATSLVAVAFVDALRAVRGSSSYVALGAAPRSMASLVGVGLLGLGMPAIVVAIARSSRPLRGPVATLLGSAPFLVAIGASRLLAMAPRRASPEFSRTYGEAVSLAFDSVPRHAVESLGAASTLACLFALALVSLVPRLVDVTRTVASRTRALAWLGASALVLGAVALPYARTSRDLASYGALDGGSLVPGAPSFFLLALSLATLVPAFVVLLVDREASGLENRQALLASIVFSGPTALAAGIERLLATMPLAPSQPHLRAADLVLLFEVLPGLFLASASVAVVLLVGGLRRHGPRFTDLAWLAPIAAFAVLAALAMREGLGGWTFFASW